MMKEQKPAVWIVIHCEYLQGVKEIFIDEAVFAAFSSRQRAERYLRKKIVFSNSWWKVERHDVDDPNGEAPTCYYDYRGNRVERPPYARAKRNLKRYLKSGGDINA